MKKEFEKLQEMKLWDWFIEKYDGECYKVAEAEQSKTKKNLSWWNRYTITTEEERQWLIKRTKKLLDNKWKQIKEKEQ